MNGVTGLSDGCEFGANPRGRRKVDGNEKGFVSSLSFYLETWLCGMPGNVRELLEVALGVIGP